VLVVRRTPYAVEQWDARTLQPQAALDLSAMPGFGASDWIRDVLVGTRGTYLVVQHPAVDPSRGPRGTVLRALVPNRPLNDAVQTGTATLDATGPGVAASGFVGLRYTLGRAVVPAQTGYRYARVVGAQGEGVASTGAVIFEGDLPFALGYAGWTSTLGLGVVLW